MTASARRRRGVLLLLVAALAGSMAAQRGRREERAIQAQVDAAVPVVVARVAIAAPTRIGPAQIANGLAVVRIPARFVPPGAVHDPRHAVGATTAVDLPRGAY